MQPVPYLSGPRGGSVTLAAIFTALGGEDGITAFAGGGQGSATALLATVWEHRVATVATAADSVKLPAATVGQAHFLRNDGAAIMQVFGQATETINAVASATGVPHGIGQGIWYVCTTAGAWTTADAFLTKEAAAITALRSGTTAQFFEIYETVDAGTANYSRMNLGFVAANNEYVVGTQAAGTGTARQIAIKPNNTRIWIFQTTGHMIPVTANTYDFGASGQTIRNLWLGSAIKQVGGILTAGAIGTPAIVATGRVTAQSAANASISTFTVGAADGSFEVSANMNVTASTTLVTTLTCTYTDEASVARTMILPVVTTTGTFVAAGAITGAGASVWHTPTMHIRCKATTAITILTSAGTFTGITYTAEGIIKQTA